MDLIQKASKLGYKHYTEFTIKELDELILDDLNKQIEYYLIRKWLREIHDIHITILLCGHDYHQYILHDKNRKYIKCVDNTITYENHKCNWEDTLEKGLQEALMLIIKKKE